MCAAGASYLYARFAVESSRASLRHGASLTGSCSGFWSVGPTCNCLSGGPSLDDHHQLSPVLPARAHGRPMRDRHLSVADESLLFESLLSIGTLGLVPIGKEATTTGQAEAEPETEHIQESAVAAAATTAVEAIAE